MAKIVAGKASIAMSADPVRTATNRPPDAPAIASPIRSTTWASLLARERTAIAWHSQDGQDGNVKHFLNESQAAENNSAAKVHGCVKTCTRQKSAELFSPSSSTSSSRKHFWFSN